MAQTAEYPFVDRQVMEEIGKGLGMHQPVLERNREYLSRYLVREIIDGLPIVSG